MQEYTKIIKSATNGLSVDDENYTEKLLEISLSFRRFDSAMNEFLQSKGYENNIENTEQKVQFIKSKFAENNVPQPRNIKDWFIKGTTISRDTAFKLCFAFNLNVADTNEFFRKVQLERSFDCHNVKEAVYYFCIKNGLPYSVAVEILSQIPKEKQIPKDKVTDENVLYTGTIIDSLDKMTSTAELVLFLNENIDNFGYNNATATKSIKALWDKISAKGGIAEKEAKLISEFNADKKSDDNYVVVGEDKDNSAWRVLSQIFGIDNYTNRKLSEIGERTIQPILMNNALLPKIAEKNFPNRQSIDKIKNGTHVEHETVRKLLILLRFYSYFAEISINNKNLYFISDSLNAERCRDAIDSLLLEAGYPEMYEGNPYDWIFIWAMNDIFPLPTFRYYMGELLAFKSEETQSLIRK